MNDIFLKIISGEIPAVKVYEDAETYSFMDIKPSNKGHVLVVPKQRYRNILDIDAGTWSKVAETARKVAVAVQRATGADGMNLIMNNEIAGGQEVFHAHVHIIPRFKDDDIFQPVKHTSYEDGEAEQIAEAIRNFI